MEKKDVTFGKKERDKKKFISRQLHQEFAKLKNPTKEALCY